jgi:hypothetical protein
MKPFKETLALLLVSVALAGSVGCSKSGGDDAASVDESGNAAAPAVPEKGSAEAAQAVAAANAAMAKNDYDAAIAALITAQASEAPMSDAQKNQHRQAVQDVTTRLLEASQNDPKAMEAYQNLGRLMKRR